MATHQCPPDIAIAIAARLQRANTPFRLEVMNRSEASVECMNQETLDIAIKQVKAERFDAFAWSERRAVKRPEITGSMEYPQLQNLPRETECDCANWHTQGQCSRCKDPSRDDYTHTATGRIVKPFEPELQRFPRQISETEQQQKFFAGPASRIPATVGDTPACGMTDTEFDSGEYVPDASDLNEMRGEDQH